ncbi:hypothetical protein BRC72_11730 [Halobacteriales archaeon QH_7_66_36]|nr:MAG: hypothetical protein BRC72_11730 [Halobacteriales archaeon QH_7_66_36]
MSESDNSQDPSENEGTGKTEDEQDENNECGRTKVRFRAYDLEVEAESKEASFEKMASTLSEEFAEMRRDAMVAEYEEIEERNLHSFIIGGD